ncbi:transmembrane protein 220 isoform X1 [Podarcis muralis]
MCAPEVDRAPLSTGGAGEGRVRERAMEAAAASLPGLKRESPPPPPPPPSAGASSRVWRLSNLVMAVFFGLAGAVQVGDGAALGVGGGREKCARSSLAVCGWAKVNDPDPGLWIVAYSVPAALTLVVGLSPPIADNIVWRSLSDLHSAACLVGSAILGYSLFTNAQKSILHEEEGRYVIISFFLHSFHIVNLPLKLEVSFQQSDSHETLTIGLLRTRSQQASRPPQKHRIKVLKSLVQIQQRCSCVKLLNKKKSQQIFPTI